MSSIGCANLLTNNQVPAKRVPFNKSGQLVRAACRVVCDRRLRDRSKARRRRQRPAQRLVPHSSAPRAGCRGHCPLATALGACALRLYKLWEATIGFLEHHTQTGDRDCGAHVDARASRRRCEGQVPITSINPPTSPLASRDASNGPTQLRERPLRLPHLAPANSCPVRCRAAKSRSRSGGSLVDVVQAVQ